MYTITEAGQDIQLIGKSGERYSGKIYSEKEGHSELTGAAIVCLSNSTVTEEGWQHQINSIYNTQNIEEEIKHYQTRDDISHLILLPYSSINNSVPDKVDDLIRSYLHK